MWIDPNTCETALTHSEVRALRPLWSGPSVLTDEHIADLGFLPVTRNAPGYDSISQVVTELAPVLVDGAWVQQWEITNLSPEQAEANLGDEVRKRIAKINEWRLKANSSAFPYGGKKIAVDTVSFNDIISTNGYVALFGEFAPGWPGGWKTVDNSYVPITTVEDWKDFYRAMYDQGNRNFLHAQHLKQLLAAATTQDQIDAVTWETVTPWITQRPATE